jgi:hypothetical protein
MRRDAYANHVKAKHMKDIATLILEDFKDCDSNAIANYAANRSTISLPINSKMYQDAEYWFGVKPLFYIRESIEIPHDPTRPDTKVKGYPEDLELSSYLKREENLIAHRKFVEEALQSISLMDFIQIRKDLMIRNPNITIMQKELSTLRAAHKELEESSKNQVERLKKDVELWKETAEEKECIADLRKDLQSARSMADYWEKEKNMIKVILDNKDREQHEQWEEINRRSMINDQQTYERESNLYKKFTKAEADTKKANADYEELKVKFKLSVKEAAQKLFDEEKEKKQKEKDKKALEKLKRKKAAKKAKKLAEMSDSDDSGSDSD